MPSQLAPGHHHLVCPGCGVESDIPVSLLDGHLVGPMVTLRVRSTRGEHGQRMLSLTCPACGLVSQFDADHVDRERNTPGG